LDYGVCLVNQRKIPCIKAITEVHKPFEARVKTLTYDNDKEFSVYAKMDQAFGCADYFAPPLFCWELSPSKNFN
jgi:IS30 family transposase